MGERTWTKAQLRAIEETGNIIVSAGAGSGKTAVLSERVYHFIAEENYSIDNFLLLTFTNLAAGEMKDRIRKRLAQDPKTNIEASKVDTSDISTFDGYANKLVKKYHFLLNVSPSFINIDKTIMDVKRRSIIQDIFNELYLSKDNDFLHLIDKYCFKDDEAIQKMVLKIHAKAELQLDKENFLDTFVETRYNEEYIRNNVFNPLYKKLESLKEDLHNSFYDLPEDFYIQKEKRYLTDHMLDVASNFLSSSNYDSYISTFNFSYPKCGKDSCADRTSFDASKANWAKIGEELKVLPQTEKEFFDLILDNKEDAETLIKIVKELDKRQYAFKEEKQAFEFNDIAKMALNLVSSNESVRNALKNQYKMILIDEYQDTSEIQEELISLIANNNVYMVGDIKQSIYAFRNARSDIFKKKYLKYKKLEDGKAIDMNKNFRSRDEVLSDINDFFSSFMTLDYGDADYKKDHIIEFGNTKYEENGCKDKNNNYHTTFITYSKGEMRSNEASEKEIRIIAEDIITKINNGYKVFIPFKDTSARKASFKDFCILIDQGTNFDLFKKIFNEYQIPLYVEENEDISKNIIILLLKNLFIVLNTIKEESYETNIDFKPAYISLARSFLFEYSDEKIYEVITSSSFKNDDIIKTLKEVLDTNSSLPIYLIIEKVIEKLDFYVKLIRIGDIEKNEAYLDKFLSYFKDMSKLDYSLNDFISYLDNIEEYELKIDLPSTSTSLDSVKIMNIHKSKGLEFPIIYFPMLGSNFLKKATCNEYDIDEIGISLPVKDEKKHPLRIVIDNKRKKEALSERIRLFYVALTRAKEKMIFVLNDEYKIKNIEEANSFVDFISPIVNSSKYQTISYVENDDVKLTLPPTEIKKEKFNFTPITFNEEKITLKHASKQLVLETNTEVLELGTHLHEVMEILDFKNPDYSFIKDQKIVTLAKSFLENPLNKDILNAEGIYKEYEFIDNDVHGIIDLLVIYKDHVDIIDYKTKHIDDENYDNQLEVYYNFIVKKLPSKQVRAYLYSLIDKTYREVKIEQK